MSIAVLCGAGTCHAATLTWTGGGANDNWTTTANWSPAQAPANNDTLVFPGTSARKTTNNNNTTANNDYTINFTGGGYVLSGNVIDILAISNGTNAGNNTISAPLRLTGNRTFTINSAGDTLTITSVISQDSNGRVLTSSGAGTLVLNGTNTYSGGLTLTASSGTTILGNNAGGGSGTITVNNATTLVLNGVTVANNVSLTNGGTVRAAGNATYTGDMTVATNASVTLSTTNASDVFSFGNGNNDLTGGNASVTLNVAGPGLLQLNNSNDVVGNWNLTGGTLRISADGALGNTANDMTIGAGGLRVSGNVNFNAGRVFTLAAGGDRVIEVDTGFTVTINDQNQLTGSGRLSKTGAGEILISASQNFSGGTLLNGSGSTTTVNGVALDRSQLRLQNNSALGSGTITMNGGTMYADNGDVTTLSNALNVIASSFLTSADGDDFEFTSNSMAGSVGTTLYWVNQSMPVSSAHSIYFNGSGFTYAGDIFIDNQSRLRFDNGTGTQIFSGSITGGGYSADLGTLVRGYPGSNGVTILTGTVNLSGTITANAGTLRIDGTATVNGNINVVSGATLAMGATGLLQLNNGNTITVDGTLQSALGSNWTSNFARIRSVSGTYGITINGSVDISWLKIENLNASGMVLANNSTVAFNHVWFDRGTGGGTGTYITSQKNQNFTINNTSFAAGYVNYGVTNT
ncbi:MAG: hypothetical protein KIS92_20915, partial [Planctomycetota bacterium]|nr:hypothetical protein [Planctomycetota bacterium]